MGLSDQIIEYLDGVEGVVEATSFEQHSIWRDEHLEHQTPWEETRSGYGVTIGTVAGMPVAISLLTATVDGHKILFVDATSRVVDYEMVRGWIDQNMPVSARDDDRVNYTDAMNFCNVMHAIRRRHSKDT